MKTAAYKKISFLFVLALVVALGSTLVACGGGGEVDVVGDWKLSSMEEDGEVTSEEDLAMLEEMGMSISLSFTADNKVTMDMFGEIMEGTWKSVDGSTVDITFEGETAQAKVADGKITMEEDGAKMVFSKS